MSSRRPALASRASFDNDVDDAALDDLLGSDTESVSNKLSRGKPRLSPAAASASSVGVGRPSTAAGRKSFSALAAEASKGDWDEDSDGNKSPGSDDGRPASSSRRPPSRPLPHRNRALPTKKPSAAANSGQPSSQTDDLDSALFGIGGGGNTAATRSTLTAPSEDDVAVQRPRSRSRTLDARRDESAGSSNSRLEDEEDDWDTPASSAGQAERVEDSRHTRTRPRSGLSIDDDVAHSLAQVTKQLRNDEEQKHAQGVAAPSNIAAAASDDVNDRRARYREMMAKRKQERESATTSQPPTTSAPTKPPPPQPADDPWSTLDDPLSSIGDQPSAASKIAQSLAAFGSSSTVAKEELMPLARTQPVAASVEDSGSLLGGRRPRALVGRRAGGLQSASLTSVGDEPQDRPTTAPSQSVSAAPLTTQPAVLKVEVTAAPPQHSPPMTVARPHTSSAASASTTTAALPTSSPFASITSTAPSPPSFSMWCQWLGIDTASSADQPLLVIARRAAAQPLPAHIVYRDGVWHNSRTGRRTSDHPALSKWRKKLEQKQLAIKYNVDDDDSEEEDSDSFWRDVDELQVTEERKQQEQQQQQQQGIPAEVAAVMSSSPTLAALASSSFVSRPLTASPPPSSAAPFGQSALPSFMTHSIAPASPTAQLLPQLTAFSLPPAATAVSAVPSSSVIEEALAQQRTTLTREFQQQLTDAIAHHMQLNTLTQAQRAKEDEDRRRRDEARHSAEVAALREQLYDSRVMRGLTDSIEAGVRGVEELREKASDEKKQRDEEREQTYKLREDLITQREKAVEQSIAHYNDKRKQAEAEAQAYQRDMEALKQDKATLVASLQAEREEVRLQRRQLQAEKELLIAEKDKYISESSKWERERAEQHDMVTALREMIERKHRQADEELQSARDDRASIMAQLNGEKEEARLQRELIGMRRRRLDEDENKLQTARDELALREAEISEQVAMVQRLGLQLNRQSAALVNERRLLDDERRRWDIQQHQQTLQQHDDKHPITPPYHTRHASVDQSLFDINGSGGQYASIYFAPFLASPSRVGMEGGQSHVRELSAADLKLLECESELMVVADGGEVGWE